MIKYFFCIQISKQLAVENIRVNPSTYCKRVFSTKNLNDRGIPLFKLSQQLPRGFTSDIACAGTEISLEGACKGDSGSPLVRLRTEYGRREPFYEQTFLVSAGVSCELEATLYTRVSERKILNWIQEEAGKKHFICSICFASFVLKTCIL